MSGRIRYVMYTKTACVEKKFVFWSFFYKKILLIKIIVTVYHLIGSYIGTGHVFC